MRDEAAFEAFYAATAPGLLRALALLLQDRGDAEDVLQEAFARTAGRWDRVSRLDSPAAWTRRVAMNLATDRHRRRSRHATVGLSADVAVHLDATAVEVAEALRLLPLVQRQVVVLHHLLDLPVDEVAATLRRRPTTVKTQLARGRARLALLLTVDEEAQS